MGVDGIPLRVKGTAMAQLEKKDNYSSLEAIIADLRTEAILDVNFFEAHQCAIDLPRGANIIEWK